MNKKRRIKYISELGGYTPGERYTGYDESNAAALKAKRERELRREIEDLYLGYLKNKEKEDALKQKKANRSSKQTTPIKPDETKATNLSNVTNKTPSKKPQLQPTATDEHNSLFAKSILNNGTLEPFNPESNLPKFYQLTYPPFIQLPITIKNTKQESNAVLDLAREMSAQFDPAISKATQKRDKLYNDYLNAANNADITPQGSSITGYYGIGDGQRKINAAYNAYLKSEKDLLKLLQQKNDYVKAVVTQASPNERYESYTGEWIKALQFYKNAKAEYDEARLKASANMTPQNRDRFLKSREQLLQIDQMSRDLGSWMKTHGRLPKNIQELPKSLLGFAKKVFYDGKALEDDNIRSFFYDLTHVSKDDISRIGNSVYKNITSGEQLSEEDIKKFKEELELLEEAYRSKETEAGEKIFGKNSNYLKALTSNHALYSRFGNTDITSADFAKQFAENLYFLSNVNKDEKKAQEFFEAAQKKLDTIDAISLVDKALHHKEINDAIVNAEKKYSNFRSGLYNIGKGVYEFFTDRDSYDNGFSSLLKNMRLNQIADKMQKDEKLTSTELDYARAYGIESIAHNQWGEYEDKAGYKAGKMFAESLKFMAEFIATNGMLRGLQSAAKTGATKMLMKSAANKASVKAAEELIEKYGVRKAKQMLVEQGIKAGIDFGRKGVQVLPTGTGAKAAYGAARVGADALYAFGLENTLQLTRIANDAEKLKLGDVDTYVDNDGEVQVRGFNNRVNSTDAWILSEKRGFVENFSEMMGEFGIGTYLGKQLGKIPGVSAVTNFLSNKYKKIATSLAKRGIGKSAFNAAKAGQYHGFFGEVSEEYYGIVMNHILGSQEDPNKNLFEDITDKQQFLDIVGGIALSSAFLGTISTGNYFIHHRNFNKAKAELRQQFGEELAKKIENSVIFADETLVATVMNNLIDGATTVEKKEALTRYYDSLMRYRGAAIGEEKLLNKYLYNHDKRRMLAREAGYNTASYNHKVNLDRAIGLLKPMAAESLGVTVDELDDYINNNGGVSAIVQNKLDNGEWETEEDANALLSYDNATNVAQGISLRLSDDMYDEAQKQKRAVLRRQNASGMILPAITTDDKKVFIISGDVKTKPGSNDIDYSSDSKITVIDENNNRKILSIKDIKVLEKGSNAEVLSDLAFNWTLQRQFDLDKYLDNFQMQPGMHVDLEDGKMLTVVGANVHKGIIYTISDRDGSNVQVFAEENPLNFRQIVQNADERKAVEITNLYLNKPKKFDLGLNNSIDVEELNDNMSVTRSTSVDYYQTYTLEEDPTTPTITLENPNQYSNDPLFSTTSTLEAPITTELNPTNTSDEEITAQMWDEWYNGGEYVAPISEQPNNTQNKPSIEQPTASPKLPKEQQDSLTKLLQKIDTDNNALNKKVNGSHYFLTVDGKRKIYRRVHSIIGDKYDEAIDDEKYRSKYSLQLLESWDDSLSIDENILNFRAAVQKCIEDRQKRFPIESIEDLKKSLLLDEYIEYLKENPEDLNEVITGISSILSRDLVGWSVDVGTLIDAFGREFFKHDGKLALNDVKVELRGVEHNLSEFVSLDVFEDMMNLFTILREVYNQLEWTVITDPCLLYVDYYDNNLKLVVSVAGETDAVAVDKEGNYHILDFKTYNWARKKHFLRKLTSTLGVETIIDDFSSVREDEDALYTYSTFITPYYRKPKHSDYTQYLRLLSMYANAASVQLGHVSTIECIMMGMEYKTAKGKGLESITKMHLLVPSIDGTGDHPNRRELMFDKGLIDRFIPWSTDVFNTLLTLLLNYVDELKKVEFQIDSAQFEKLSADTKSRIQNIVNRKNEIITNKDNGVYTTDNDVMTAIALSELLLNEVAGFNIELSAELDEIARKEEAEEQRKRKEDEDKARLITEEDAYNQMFSEDVLFAKQLIEDFNLTYEELKNFITVNFFREQTYDVSEITAEQTVLIQNLLTRLFAVYDNLEELGLYVDITDDQLNVFNAYYKTRDWCIRNIFNPKKIDINTEEDEYRDFWYHRTTTYKTTAVKEGGYLSYGIEDSVAPDGSKLLEVTANPDFITNAVFEFCTNPGYQKQYIAVRITYRGKTYSPVTLNIATRRDVVGKKIIDDPITRRGSAFINFVRHTLNEQQSDEIVVPTVLPSRTNGRIKEGSEGTLIEKGLVSTSRKSDGSLNLYDIEYTANQLTFCIITGSEVQGVKRVVAQIPNTSGLRGRNTVYTYSPKPDSNPSVGTYVMMVPRMYDELPAGTPPPVVPINLLNKSLTEHDAQLVIDILTGKYANGAIGEQMLDQEFVEDGVGKVLTNRDVLNMLVSYGHAGQKGKKVHVHFKYDSKNPNIVYLLGKLKDDEDYIGKDGQPLVPSREFHLNDPESLGNLKRLLLSLVKVNISEDFMGQRFANGMNGSIMYKLATAINKGKINLSNGAKLTFGKSSIQFELADFKENDNDTQGLSGLGWYIKNGFLKTTFDGFENTLICFNDRLAQPVKRVKKETLVQQKTHDDKAVEQQDPIVLDDIDDDTYVVQDYDETDPKFDSDLWNKIQSTSEESSIDRTTAEEHIRAILGDVKVDWVEDFIELLDQKAGVVGRCYADAILLSDKAVAGVEYHESFHRIVELLLSDKKRERLYKSYRNAYKERANMTDKEVAEALADEFMYFMFNKPTAKLSWNVKETLESFKQWVTFYKKIGSFGLYRMYAKAKRGGFRNKQVSEERKARFKEFAKNGYLNFTIRNTELSNILNEHDYKKLCESLIFTLLDSKTQVVDWSGIQVSLIKTDLATMLKSGYLYNILISPSVPQRTKQAIIEMVGIKTDKDGVAEFETEEYEDKIIDKKTGAEKTVKKTKFKTFKKANNNWDAIEPDIVSKMSRFVSNYKVAFEEEANASKENTALKDSKKTIDEPYTTSEEDAANSGAEAVEGHVKRSYEFEPIERSSARVKFFFSGIPRSKFVLVKGKRKLAPVENELGLFEFYDHKETFAYVLNMLHHVEGIHLFKDELEKLSEQSPMFAQIYNRFMKRWNNAFEVVNGTEVVKNENERALIVQIVRSIRNCENEFLVALSHDGISGRGIDIVSTDRAYNSRNYRKDWSSVFASGSSYYIGIDENGKYKMKKNMSPRILQTVAARLGNLHKTNSTYNDYGIAYAFSAESLSNPNNRHYTINIPVLKTVDGKTVTVNESVIADIYDPTHLLVIKENLVKALNMFGIQVNIDILDHTLLTQYGDTGVEGMISFVRDGDQVNEFAKKIMNMCSFDKQGGAMLVIPSDIKTIWDKLKIVDTLAKGKYDYIRSTVQLSVLTVGNDKYYTISENNLLTQRLQQLENDSQFLSNMTSDPYNTYQEENIVGLKASVKGSRILMEMNKSEGRPHLRYVNLAGFKTDARGSEGVKYDEQSEREDYIAKLAMLAKGILISPTMSDKVSYGGIEGMPIFGIDYTSIKNSMIPRVTNYQDGTPLISWPEEVIDQFIQYAKCEYNSVLCELELELNDKDKVDNFHKGKTVHVLNKDGKLRYIPDSEYKTYTEELKQQCETRTIRQGARFSSLLGVHYLNPLTGKWEFKEFNRIADNEGNYMDEYANLKEAEKWFFGVDGKLQRQLIAQELTYTVMQELSYMLELELVQASDEKDLTKRYSEIGLDNIKIGNIARALFNLEDNTKPTRELMSYALVSYVADISAKAIMSQQENERIYSGNPAYTKYVYDNQGHLVDRVSDMFKRFGGLVSTGQDNCLDQPDIRKNYVCAEVEDEIVVSPFADTFEQIAFEGELRTALIAHRLNTAEFGKVSYGDPRAREIYDDVDTMDIEKVKEELGDTAVKVIESSIKLKAAKLRNVNVADGAAYITDEACENLLKMLGIYDESLKRAFRILRGIEKKEDGTYYTVKDVRETAEAYNKVYTTVIGTQKYTAYGFRPTVMPDGTIRMQPYYNKMALFPIFKCMATGPMAKIYEKMMDPNNKVDMLLMKSAVKLGGKGAVSLGAKEFESWEDPENGEKNFQNFKFNTYVQSFSYLRKQFNTDPKDKHVMSMGTQMTKVVLAALVPGAQYDVDGVAKDATVIRDDIMHYIRELSNEGFLRMKKKFFNEDDTLNVDKFSKELTELLSSRDANRNVLDSVSVVEYETTDPKTGNIVKKKKLKLPLAAQSGVNWILSVIASMIDSEVIDINTPGHAFYLRSVWGMESTENNKRTLTDEDLPADINDGKKLQMVNEEGSMDCVLSIDFFDDLWKEMPQLRNQSFETKRNWLIRNGIISGTIRDPKAKDDGVHYTATSNMIGYRIPTQAVSSIHALRCVDVIPVVRDTIILPKEFTAITGSDFDIDKVFISRLNYHRQLVKDVSPDDYVFGADPLTGTAEPLLKKFQKPKHILTSDFKEGTDKYYQNLLLKSYIAVLKNNKNAMALLHGAIDSDTSLLESVRDELRSGLTKRPVSSYYASTLRTHVKTRKQFSTGKTGIGPYALNNNNHILTMLYGVKFDKKSDSILTLLSDENCDMHDLSKNVDRDGKRILSWLSGLINAHVDVAKDPFIPELGVDSYTYNTVSLLIRTGFGRDTFFFTTLPIIRDFATAHINSSGVYLLDSNTSKYTRQRRAVDKLFVQYINKNLNLLFSTDKMNLSTSKNKAIEYFKYYFKSKYGVDVKWAMLALMSKEGCAQLAKISKQKLSKDDEFDFELKTKYVHTKISMFDVQTLVALTKFELDPYEAALSSLVQYTKIDTKKQGRTIGEQNAYAEGYRNLFEAEKSLFDRKSLLSLKRNSFIGRKTDNALSLFRDILSQQLIQGSDLFDVQLLQFAKRLNSDRKDQKFQEKLTKLMLAKIKSNFFFGEHGYCASRNIDAKALVTGNNTIYDRLNRFRTQVLIDPTYASLVNKHGEILNYLLQNLVPDTTYEINMPKNPFSGMVEDDYPNAKFVKSLNMLDDDPLKEDEFTQAWEDLLNDSEHPELQKFAEDLVVYAFMTSADNGGKFDLFKYVPLSWKVGTCSIFDKSIGTYEQYMSDVLDQYIQGTYVLDMQDFDDIILNSWYDYDIVPTVYDKSTVTTFVGTGHIPMLLSGINAAGELTFDDNPPVYFKTYRLGIKNGMRSINLYELVNWGVRINNNSLIAYPIYQLVQPRGTKFQLGHTIYSFSRDDSSKQEAHDVFLMNVYKNWVEALQQQGYTINNIEDFLKALTHAISSGKYTILAWLDVVEKLPDLIQRQQFTSLFKTILDYINYLDITHIVASDPRDVSFLALELRALEERNQMLKKTPLDLDKIDDRYSKASLLHPDNLRSALIGRALQLADGLSFNVELYKKQSRDGSITNNVVAISLKGHNDMGFFEIVEDVDLLTKKPNGEYSLYFHTIDVKSRNESKFASIPITKKGKESLFKAVLYTIPNNGKISTHGEVSKGAIHAFETLDQRTDISTAGMVKDGTREVIEQSSGKTIEIPVWRKDLTAAYNQNIANNGTYAIPARRRDVDYRQPGDRLYLTQLDLTHIKEIVYFEDEIPDIVPEGVNALLLLEYITYIDLMREKYKDSTDMASMQYYKWKAVPENLRQQVLDVWLSNEANGYERYDANSKVMTMDMFDYQLLIKASEDYKFAELIYNMDFEIVTQRAFEGYGAYTKYGDQLYSELLDKEIKPYLKFEYRDDRLLEFNFDDTLNDDIPILKDSANSKDDEECS